MLCETNTTVRPDSPMSSIRPRQRRWNSASPTASTSSTSRISGSRCAATEKASRTYIPLEYRFTGVSMNLLDPGELDDLVELGGDLAPVHAEDRRR